MAYLASWTEFLPDAQGLIERRASPLARLLAATIALLFFALVGWMAWAEVEQVVRAGALEINSHSREVTRGGEPVNLTATEFDVLWCLVEASNRPLSREEILSRVWGPGHHGTLRTIDNFVLQLRAKLENDPSEPEHLLTVRGVGYRFRS